MGRRMQTEGTKQRSHADVLFPVIQNGRVGFINRSGQTVIAPQFDSGDRKQFRVIGAVSVRGFREGLAPVQVGQKWAYVDSGGKIAIDPEFEEAGVFHEGLAPVKISGRWGYIDPKGKITVNPQFDEAGQFNNGFASVKKDDKWGFIDPQGEYLVRPQFDAVAGRSWTLIRNPDHGLGQFSEKLAGVKVGNKWGYIDRSGKLVPLRKV